MPDSFIKPSLLEMISLRDNVRLYTEIFIPGQSDTESYPVVLFRSPYCYSLLSRYENQSCLSRYLQAGYAVVFQLTRGQGPSEGEFRRYVDDVDDGYDTIEWVAQQPWCDGQVGMCGPSYLGSVQLLAAKASPPSLKCIMPTAFVGNQVTCYPFSNGVPNKLIFLQWYELLDVDDLSDMSIRFGDSSSALSHPEWQYALSKRPLIDSANHLLSGDKLKSWRESISHPLDNDFWDLAHFTENELAELDIPIFFTDGWYDMTVGPIDFFAKLEKIRPERKDRYLLVGPWDHYQTYSSTCSDSSTPDLNLCDNKIDHMAHRLAFFDRYLKGNSSSIVQKDRVKVFISGGLQSNANCWLDLPTFPPPGSDERRMYLCSEGNARSYRGDGALLWDKPSYDSRDKRFYKKTDTYSYDPAVPTAFQVESFSDRRDLEVRSDVLTYTSYPLEEPLTILGDIILVLYAASDAPDTDWFTLITEVFPDGRSKSFHFFPPAFRARYREGFDREVFLSPNKPEEFTIPMGSAGHQFAVGNRIRLSIFSSAFPEYDPNTNTGNYAATDTEVRSATQTIYHDGVMSSHLVLPVIRLEQFR